MSDLDKLEQLEKAATPGPWNADYVQAAIRHLSRNVDPDYYCTEEQSLSGNGDVFNRREDGPLIAAARNALPALLAVARAAEALHGEDAPVDMSETQRLALSDAVFDALAQLKESIS